MNILTSESETKQIILEFEYRFNIFRLLEDSITFYDIDLKI